MTRGIIPIQNRTMKCGYFAQGFNYFERMCYSVKEECKTILLCSTNVMRNQLSSFELMDAKSSSWHTIPWLPSWLATSFNNYYNLPLQTGTPDNTLANPTPHPIKTQLPTILMEKIITKAETRAVTPNLRWINFLSRSKYGEMVMESANRAGRSKFSAIVNPA